MDPKHLPSGSLLQYKVFLLRPGWQLTHLTENTSATGCVREMKNYPLSHSLSLCQSSAFLEKDLVEQKTLSYTIFD